MKSILALFPTATATNVAIDNLRALGFSDEVMSVVTTKNAVDADELDINHDSVKGVKEGAKTGAAIGGLLGLIAGIGTITIPGFGVLLIGGPLATALGLTSVAGAAAGGALTGALAGGLLSTFKEIGIDEVQAKLYEEKVKSGFILLGVAVPRERVDEIEGVLKDAGAEDVRSFDLKPITLNEEDEEIMNDTDDNLITDSSSSHKRYNSRSLD